VLPVTRWTQIRELRGLYSSSALLLDRVSAAAENTFVGRSSRMSRINEDVGHRISTRSAAGKELGRFFSLKPYVMLLRVVWQTVSERVDNCTVFFQPQREPRWACTPFIPETAAALVAPKGGYYGTHTKPKPSHLGRFCSLVW